MPEPIDSGLAERFRSSMPETPDGPCPSADDLWAAARGELAEPRLEALATHLRSCALCGEALAVSAELAGEAEPRTAPLQMPLGSRWTRLGAGAVSLAALAAGFALMHLQRGSPPAASPVVVASRGQVASQGSIRAVSPEEQPRSAVRLAWTPVERAVRYRVQVSSEDLRPLWDRTLEQNTSLPVPPALGASPERPSVLHWQVDAMLPDGRVVTSPTFSVRLLDPPADPGR